MSPICSCGATLNREEEVLIHGLGGHELVAEQEVIGGFDATRGGFGYERPYDKQGYNGLIDLVGTIEQELKRRNEFPAMPVTSEVTS